VPKIIEYKKLITPDSTYELRDVEGTELCTIGDTTYFVIPGTALPTGQAAEIQGSIQLADLSANGLRAKIKAESPHCNLVKVRRKQRIFEKGYTEEDQIAFLHIAAGQGLGVPITESQSVALATYVAVCKEANDWAEAQYVALGL